jgi:hypothetical protein
MKSSRRNPITRRAVLLTGIAGSLTACEAPYGLDYKTIGNSLAVSLGFKQAPGITLEQASQVPYSSLGYRVGDSAEQMLILGSASGHTKLWTSGERRLLVTKSGRITKTAGFAWNLSETYWSSPDALLDGRKAPLRPNQRVMDFGDIKKFGTRVRGQFELKEESSVAILGANISTLTLSETCHCDDFDWDFENLFWIDRQTGFVWRSIQYVHPNLAPLTVEILRPPE